VSRIASFLPKQPTNIDGELVELKTVSGNRNTLGTAFEEGFKQGAAVVQDYLKYKHIPYLSACYPILPLEV